MSDQPPPSRTVFEFGEARWDAGARILTLRGTSIRLTWRSMECLHALLEARGDVVTREKFHERVWGSAAMEDSNLAHAIASIRKALGPSPNGGSYIETVAKMGYRLAVTVEVAGTSPEAGPSPTPSTTDRWWIRWVTAGLVLLIATSSGYTLFDRAQRTRKADEKTSEAFAYLRRGTMPDGKEANTLFEAALKIQPNYPPARAGLAEASIRFGKGPGDTEEELVRDAWKDDASCTDCRAILGYVLMVRGWEWEEAGEHLAASVRAEPEEVQWRLWYGQWLAVMGRHDEAAREAETAIAKNPSRAHAYSLLAAVRFFQGQYEEAERRALESVTLEDRHVPGHQWLQRIYMMLGRDSKVIQSRHFAAVAWSDGTSEYDKAFTKQLYGILESDGRIGLVNALMAELSEGQAKEVNRYQRATWQMWVGNRDEALRELEAAVLSRPFNMIYTAVDPAFAPLHNEPRFRALVYDLGLANVLAAKTTSKQAAAR